MEIETTLYNAVFSGNLSFLKYLYCSMKKSEIKELTSKKIDTTTLLLIAARYGHYQVMKFLIEYCEVDIEEVGEVEFDGEIVEETPPLWCAAAAGHLDCVKLLLDNGANVNCTTHTNSTPLRAACFDGHFEIVKLLVERGADIEIPNDLGHTCLMISCYKRHYNIAAYLIEQGCQINRQGVKGNTALHDCAESNSMDILKLLVKNGATFKQDCFGLTPLMTASLCGSVEIFNYLKSVFECSIENESDAYRLLGATFVDKFNNLTEAFKYWKCAAKLSSKCSKKYQDSLVKNNESFLKAYGNNTEFKNEEDLDKFLYDPELMKIQAMMIRERILGLHHRETYYFIRFHGASYVESGDHSKCLALWMYNLEQQQIISQPLSEIIQNSYISMVDLFTYISFNQESDLKVCDIQMVLKMAMSQVLVSCNIKPNINENNSRIYRILNKFLLKDEIYSMFNDSLNKLDRQFVIILHLIGFMCQCQNKMTPDEESDFKNLIRKFLLMDPRSTNSHSLLHIICILACGHPGSLPLSEISLFDIFKFIVDFSVDLNICDIMGNTPLHFLLEHSEVNVEMVKYLIESGCHVDLRNVNGCTPIDYLQKKPKLQNLKIKYVSLQCLCAQVIIKNDIPSHGLPKHLQKFINDHQQKEIFLH